MKNNLHAVLTGDVVGSSSLKPDEHRHVIDKIKSVEKHFSQAIVGSVDVFSGDSWQVLFSDLKTAIDVALFVRASLKKIHDFSIDSRTSISYGRLSLDTVNPKKISESTGEIFTLSGRALKQLEDPTLMCFSAQDCPAFSNASNASFLLMDKFVCQWSCEQARAVAQTLLGKTQSEIASKYDIGQSSVNKSLQAAGWQEINSAIELILKAAEEGYL